MSAKLLPSFLCLFFAISGCSQRTPAKIALPSNNITVRTEIRIESPEDLKTHFLQHHRQNDVESMLALFYLKGASEKMVALYRNTLTTAEQLTITSAEVEEISKERQTTIPHTLTPEKLLLLRFGKANQKGLVAVEQFFYIGQQDGRYYLTLPTGE
jgi:hypothetical protein